MKELMIALMTWAGTLNGYSIPPDPPQLEKVTAEQLHYMVFPGVEFDPDNTRILGAYHGGTMYLKHSFDITRLRDIAVLTHELTHYLQDYNLRVMNPDPCYNSEPDRLPIEEEAYETHFQFLRSAGIEDPLGYMGMNELFYFFVTTCMPGD
jgi:hypothetical protein